MNILLRPGAALMARYRFGGKFCVMAVIAGVPIVAMLFLLWFATQRDILNARLERRGIEYVRSLAVLLHAVQAGGEAFAAGAAPQQLDSAARAVDVALAGMGDVRARHGGVFGSGERAQNIADHWTAIRRKGGSMTAAAALAEHEALSAEILDLMYFAAERSRLLLDPEGRSAYLQDVSVSRLPESMAAMGRASALIRSPAGGQTSGALAMAYQAASSGQQAAARGLINAFGGSDVVLHDPELAAAKSAYETTAGAFLGALDQRVRGTAGDDPVPLAGPALAATLRLDLAALDELDRYIAHRAARDRAEQAMLLAGVGASILLLAYLLYAFWRACRESLADAMTLAGRIAEGDLSHRIAARSRDEIGDLVGSLNRMSERMSELVSGVKGSSGEVLASAREVAAANADLSARTERQASSIEEMSATTEELSAAVSQSAAKIVEAGRIVDSASVQVADATATMERAAGTMGAVAERSRRVADITGVIDGIAFQTNILALNAAVEAARVGEQGRGFAVVAGEIRSLAQRSATAAKEIKDLIAETVESIGQGAELVKEAGGAIDRTSGEMARAARMMRDVGTMASEQRASIEQISAVVMEMNGVTQQNAAFVQQTSEIANRQEESARGLVSGVDGFRLAVEEAEQAIRTARGRPALPLAAPA